MGLLVLAALAAPWGERKAAAAPPAPPPKQLVATLLAPHVARRAPHSGARPIRTVEATRPITGARTVLPVLARRRGWLRVRLPGRPNGSTGWIRERSATVTATRWRIAVHTSRREVAVYRSGRLVKIFRAVVGKPATPTPAGAFFVEEAVRLAPGDVGAPFALALSARSEVLQEFEGGPGQIALHGTANVGGVLGTAVSHGCIRLDGAAMTWLVGRIGAGVPVTIAR